MTAGSRSHKGNTAAFAECSVIVQNGNRQRFRNHGIDVRSGNISTFIFNGNCHFGFNRNGRTCQRQLRNYEVVICGACIDDLR